MFEEIRGKAISFFFRGVFYKMLYTWQRFSEGHRGLKRVQPLCLSIRAGKRLPNYPRQVQFHFHKKDCCAFCADQFWQRSVQISPKSSAQYQQRLSITNISECSQRNEINKADTWLAQFYRRVNNNLNFKSFFSMGMHMFWQDQLYAWDSSHFLYPVSHHTKGYRDSNFPKRSRV